MICPVKVADVNISGRNVKSSWSSCFGTNFIHCIFDTSLPLWSAFRGGAVLIRNSESGAAQRHMGRARAGGGGFSGPAPGRPAPRAGPRNDAAKYAARPRDLARQRAQQPSLFVRHALRGMGGGGCRGWGGNSKPQKVRPWLYRHRICAAQVSFLKQ